MTALILVDLQNDFMPGGALPINGGDLILPAINKIIENKFDLIIATQDWHPLKHVSFAAVHNKKILDTAIVNGLEQILWPVHCVQGSLGAEFCPGWNHNKIDIAVQKGLEENIDSYSTFFDNSHLRSTGLYELLREKKISTLYIAGLATDYCVKFSVLDAIDLGFNVYVITDGCRAVNMSPNDGVKALREMSEAGADLITSEEAFI